MLSYVESGIIKHLLTKDLPEAAICPLDLGSKERQLRNPDLVTTYIVVVCGFAVACVVLLGERLLRRMCRGKIGIRDEFAVQYHLPYKGKVQIFLYGNWEKRNNNNILGRGIQYNKKKVLCI